MDLKDFLEIISQKTKEKADQLGKLKKEHQGLEELLASIKKRIADNIVQQHKTLANAIELSDLKNMLKENLRKKARKSIKKSTK